MRLTRSAFTFVELIVVLVIIAILSTIGFTVYESYLWTGRDTKKIVQMKELQTAFQEYSFREKLPLPDDSIQLRASWSLYAYQGYISEDILKQLSFKANVYDDTVESFPVYLLWVNQKDFQFLTYLEDPASTAFLKSQSFASTDLRTLFPKTFGKALWVLLEQETNTPLQNIWIIKSAGYYDVVTGTGMISAYLSEQKILESDQDDLRQLLPQNSCKRIMELGYSKWSGEYTISPDGITKVQVYCDMDIDGGGWMLVWRSAQSGVWNFGWLTQGGGIWNDALPYSFGPQVKNIYFSEILVARYTKGKNIDFALRFSVDSSVLKNELNSAESTVNPQVIYTPWLTHTEKTWNHIRMFAFWWMIPSNNGFWFRDNTTAWSYGLLRNKLETAGYNATYGALDERQWMIFIR